MAGQGVMSILVAMLIKCLTFVILALTIALLNSLTYTLKCTFAFPIISSLASLSSLLSRR